MNSDILFHEYGCRQEQRLREEDGREISFLNFLTVEKTEATPLMREGEIIIIRAMTVCF